MKIRSIDWLLLVLVGLVPLIWFRSQGFIISGDMLPPLSWDGFVHRFFAWDERLGGGHEMLLHFSALFFYSIEAFLSLILPGVVWVQKAEFVFWFFLSGVSIFYFLGVLLHNQKTNWGRWIGTLFYLFNLYLEPVWQGMNIANLSSYVFVPVMLGLTIEALERRRNFWFCVFAVSLLTFFAAPIGSNPPMLLASIIPFLVYGLLFCFKYRIWGSWNEFARFNGFFILVFIFSALVNAFWIIPFVLQVFVNTAQTSLEFTPGSALDWLKGLSRNTSLFNVAKMQGAWVWYEGFGEPYVPYAALYQKNILFIMLGFMLPIFAALGFIFNKNRMEGLLVGALALTGILLGTGVHPPFGRLYTWMVEHIPFFYIVRSPWYKFTLLTCIGFSGLFALLAGKVATGLKGKFRFVSFACLVLLLGFNVVYAFPVSTGKMFYTPKEREFMTHNFMHLPDYVAESIDYLKNSGGSFRVLDASPKKLQEYEWGNFGFNHPVSSFTTIPVFYSSMMNSPSLYPSDQMVKLLSQAIESSHFNQYAHLLRRFGVKYVLFPYDLHWYEMENIEAVSKVWEFLEQNEQLVLKKQLGSWLIYELKGEVAQPMEVYGRPILVPGNWLGLSKILNTESLSRENFIFVESLEESLKQIHQYPMDLLLLNMNLSQLAAFECAKEFNLGSLNRKNQAVVFKQKQTNEISIWIQASGDDLLKTENIILDGFPLKLENSEIYPGEIPQWSMIYSGELKRGEHTLYIRNPGEEGAILQVVAAPLAEYNKKLARFKDLVNQNKLNLSWLKTVSKQKKPFNVDFSVYSKEPDALRIESKDQSILEKENLQLWSADSTKKSWVQLNVKPHEKELTYFRSEQGWSFQFNRNKLQTDPALTIQLKEIENISLASHPYLFLDYDLLDLLATRARVKVYLKDSAGNQFEFETFAANSIPIYSLALYAFPDKKGFLLTGLDIEFSHDYSHRFGYRRYPEKDLIFREVSVGFYKREKTGQSHIKRVQNRFDWSLPKEIAKANLFITAKKSVSQPETEVEWKKKNPVDYQVDIQNPADSFLVFNQGYHPSWKAVAGNGKELLHVKVNGWENGYFLNRSDSKIQVQFGLQKTISKGYRVSLIIGGILMLGFIFWSRKS